MSGPVQARTKQCGAMHEGWKEIARYHDGYSPPLCDGIGGRLECNERLNVDGIKRLARSRDPLFRGAGP